jgi:hypothetical protein
MNMPKLPSVPSKEPGGSDLTTPQTPQKQRLVPFGLGPASASDPKDPSGAGLGREIIMMPRMMPGSLGSLNFTSEGRLVTVWSRSRAKPPFTDWPSESLCANVSSIPHMREVAVAEHHPGLGFL